MSSNCRHEDGDMGFTLVEVTIAMAILVIVLVLSGTLLFSMKSFAQKQQSFAEPRQTARRAIEYLSYYVRGAGDMNVANAVQPAPDALVTYYSLNGTTTQATFNNVDTGTNGDIADTGTDLFTVAKSSPGGMAVAISNWVAGGTNNTATSFSVNFSQGCGTTGDNTSNLSQFEQAVGFDTTSGTSPLFLVFDPSGFWQYYQITGTPTCTCANVSATPPAVVSLNVTAGGLSGINPPGGAQSTTCADSAPCYMTAGLQFVTFRVLTVNGTPTLEQFYVPGRLFNPGVDNPGTSFTPLLDNVEDLQVAYIYGDGTIWNSGAPGRLLNAATNCPNNVPYQQQEAVSPNTYDAVNVRGLRISVVARSAQPIPTFLGGAGGKVIPVEPPEDSTVVYDPSYYHYKLTATIMIQNRILGN
jgi:type II secretory pathway pseudopilin PulG